MSTKASMNLPKRYNSNTGAWVDMTAGENCVTDFYDYCNSKGFLFTKRLIRRYIQSLMTKPFVILSGISGTGKTKIAQLWAEFITSGDISRQCFISVRPDWMDNKALLGYHNVITGNFCTTPITTFLMSAALDSKRPYFLILDEMNLAKVEHYFSDFLSCLETRIANTNAAGFTQTPLRLHDNMEGLEQDSDPEKKIPAQLEIPSNIYIIGTVNIDETTHSFSPKVLDRAQVIEFETVDLDSYFMKTSNPTALPEKGAQHETLFTKKGTHITLKPDRESARQTYKDVITRIQEIHSLLNTSRLHFGFRVMDEILIYLNQADSFAVTHNELLDEVIAQKVLPKIQGDASIKNVLERMKELCILNPEHQTEFISSRLIARMLDDITYRGYTNALF